MTKMGSFKNIRAKNVKRFDFLNCKQSVVYLKIVYKQLNCPTFGQNYAIFPIPKSPTPFSNTYWIG